MLDALIDDPLVQAAGDVGYLFKLDPIDVLSEGDLFCSLVRLAAAKAAAKRHLPAVPSEE